MALTFSSYVDPGLARPLAVAAAALTAVNYMGIEKTAALTKAIVAVVIGSLALVVAAAVFGGEAEPGRLTPLVDGEGLRGILQAGGLLFFAFAGYARIAALGRE